MTKLCVECKLQKPVYNFYKDNHKKDRLRPECIQCHKKRKNKNKIKEQSLKYRSIHKNTINKKQQFMRKQKPEYTVLYGINQRCNNPKATGYKHYGGRGIKNYLTLVDIKFLMKRDNYWNLKKPSIDRIDNDGNYELNNCRFIELRENFLRQDRSKRFKSILQYDLKGNFIKEWQSISKAEKCLKIFHSGIIKVAQGKRKTSGGFIWKYKMEDESKDLVSIND